MDRNTLLGMLLIGAIVVTFSLLNQPSKEEQEAIKRQQDSIVMVEKEAKAEAQAQAALRAQAPAANTDIVTEVLSDSLKQVSQQENLGLFASSANGQEQFHVIENELVKVMLSNKGGSIHSVELKQYKNFEKKPLILFDGDSAHYSLNFFAQNRTISTRNLYFTPQATSFSVSGEENNSFTFRLSLDSKRYIEYVYALQGNSYQVGFTVNMVGMNEVVADNSGYINLDWSMTPRQYEKDLATERKNSTTYYGFEDGDNDHLSKSDDDSEVLKTKVKWVAFKQQFFTSAIIAKQGFEKPTTLDVVNTVEPGYNKTFMAGLTLPWNGKAVEQYDLKFYFGPNHFQTLKRMDLGMETLVPLGWGIFGWVNRFLVIPVFNFLNGFNLNYGIIILILTLLVKILLLPLTYRAYLSSAKMRVLKPEIDEINTRLKGDSMKLQQEMMGLYKKAGVNPLGGCFPMLLQLPILIAMFNFFPASIELRQESFLWAHDLSTYDSILDLPFNIPFYGDHVSLFTLLMTVSTLIYTMVNSQMTQTGMNAQMKWMMYLMPVVFLGVFNNFAAGLSYYYFLSNVVSIGQQFLIKATVDEDAIHRKIQEHKKKPQSNKKSKFQTRLEEMAKKRGHKK